MKLKNTERLMKSLISEKRVESYAVFVYKDGDTGFINSPNVDEYTYFDVASMGKVLVTSTLILQAVSRRLLSLNSCLGDFLPFAPEDKKAITVKQLLTHSSGILRYPITKRAEVDGNDAIAEEIMSYPLKFAPDTDCEYSCNGYILLGFILEKIYKKPLEAIYFENIAEPLGVLKEQASKSALTKKMRLFVTVGRTDIHSALTMKTCLQWARSQAREESSPALRISENLSRQCFQRISGFTRRSFSVLRKRITPRIFPKGADLGIGWLTKDFQIRVNCLKMAASDIPDIADRALL